LILEEDGQN